ncbi:hypothetical protein [Agromyces sp. NPDC058110]|uniref:hypothetical protein n=1 Tax=Agromyces sp. NPDC058110 TaxID=3346345 RepID=UPI0036DD8752
MLQARMRLDGREYLLPAEQDPEELMAMVTELVRAGGGFVEATRSPEQTVSVFVSPGMSLTLEVVDVPDDAALDGHEESWLTQSTFDPFDME